MPRLLLNRPRGYSLLLIRRHADAGLLRDGGMTAAEVCRYVRELRHEVEQDVALRIRKHASSPLFDKSPTFVCRGVAGAILGAMFGMLAITFLHGIERSRSFFGSDRE